MSASETEARQPTELTKVSQHDTVIVSNSAENKKQLQEMLRDTFQHPTNSFIGANVISLCGTDKCPLDSVVSGFRLDGRPYKAVWAVTRDSKDALLGMSLSSQGRKLKYTTPLRLGVLRSGAAPYATTIEFCCNGVDPDLKDNVMKGLQTWRREDPAGSRYLETFAKHFIKSTSSETEANGTPSQGLSDDPQVATADPTKESDGAISDNKSAPTVVATDKSALETLVQSLFEQLQAAHSG